MTVLLMLLSVVVLFLIVAVGVYAVVVLSCVGVCGCCC